jgi:hypothetical protein
MLASRFLMGNPWGLTSLAIVVVGNVILTGVMLSALGLLSLYIEKIYFEVVDRPLYVVREVYGSSLRKT